MLAQIMQLVVNFAPYVTLVALILALWTLKTARRQERVSRRQAADASEHTEELKKIRGSLSTKYIDKFPDFIPKITELIKRAESSIVIVASVPGYGIFSAPVVWEDYRAEIVKKKLSNVQVTLICTNRGKREEFREKRQFAQVKDTWDSWKQKHSELLEGFITHHVRDETVRMDNITFPIFLEELENAQRRVFEDVFTTVDGFQIPEHMDLYFWMRDRREAFFSIPVFTEGKEMEYGFITEDERLISALEGICEHYKRIGEPIGVGGL